MSVASDLQPIGSILHKPTLNLHSASVNTIKLGGLTRLEEAQTVNVSGNSTIGLIVEGGNRVLPGHLTINLAKGASLFDTNGAVVIRSTLVETGGVGSTFYNENSIDTWTGSHLTFGIAINGIGSFNLLDKPEYGFGGSTVEFKGAVGGGQFISIDAGRVQVDKPMQFLATVTHLNGFPKASPGYANDAVLDLKGIHATTGQYVGNDVILFNGTTIVADIHTKASAVPTLFATNEAGGGVSLSAYGLLGSSELHTGAPVVHIA